MIDLEPVLADVGRTKNFRRQAADPAFLKPFRDAQPINFAADVVTTVALVAGSARAREVVL